MQQVAAHGRKGVFRGKAGPGVAASQASLLAQDGERHSIQGEVCSLIAGEQRALAGRVIEVCLENTESCGLLYEGVCQSHVLLYI